MLRRVHDMSVERQARPERPHLRDLVAIPLRERVTDRVEVVRHPPCRHDANIVGQSCVQGRRHTADRNAAFGAEGRHL
jgi:hypothetical protein